MRLDSLLLVFFKRLRGPYIEPRPFWTLQKLISQCHKYQSETRAAHTTGGYMDDHGASDFRPGFLLAPLSNPTERSTKPQRKTQSLAQNWGPRPIPSSGGGDILPNPRAIQGDDSEARDPILCNKPLKTVAQRKLDGGFKDRCLSRFQINP